MGGALTVLYGIPLSPIQSLSIWPQLIITTNRRCIQGCKDSDRLGNGHMVLQYLTVPVPQSLTDHAGSSEMLGEFKLAAACDSDWTGQSITGTCHWQSLCAGVPKVSR